MVTIAEAQQRIAQGRQAYATAQSQLQSAAQRLPTITQAQLRSGKFAGLKGRLEREKLSKQKAQISSAQQRLQESKQKFETQAKSVEQKISEAKKASEIAREKALLKSRTIYGFRPGSVISEVRGEEPEFTEQEIGSAFQQSIAPELLTQGQKDLIRGQRYFQGIASGDIQFERVPVQQELVTIEELPFTERLLVKSGYGEIKGIEPVYTSTGVPMYPVTRERFAPTLTSSFLLESGLSTTALRPIKGITPSTKLMPNVKVSPKTQQFYETYIKDIPKGIKTATKGTVKEIKVDVRAVPLTEQRIISDPKLKTQIVEKAPSLTEIKEKGVSVVVSKTTGTTGTVRVLRKAGRPDKFLSYEPPKPTYSIGLSTPETGLYKVLPKSQLEIFKKTFLEKVAGREFSSVGDISIAPGLRTKSRAFISGTEMYGGKVGTGRSFTIKGLGRVKQLKPSRIQRTGRISGYVEEIKSGNIKVNEIVVPISEAEGIVQFKSLYRTDPITGQRIRIIAIGTEPETTTIGRISEQIPSLVTRKDTSLQMFEQIKKAALKYSPVGDIKQLSTSVKSTPKVSAKPLGIPTTKIKEETIPVTTKIKVDNTASRVLSRAKSQQREITIPKQLSKQISKQKPIIKQIGIERIAPKEKSKQIERIISRTNLLQKQSQKQIERQTRRTTTTQKITQRTKTTPKIPQPRIIPPIPKPSLPSPSQSLKKISKSQAKAYRLLVKRAGKFKPVGLFPKGKALRRGSKIVKETLAATFKIEPTKKLINQKDIDFALGKEFRTFKIRKGKKIPLPGEFIQKRKYRLSTKGEISEIMGAKKRKKRRKK